MNIETLDCVTATREDRDQRITYARELLVYTEKTLNANYASLVKCVARYHETGVAFVTSAANTAISSTGQKPKTFFRQLAKQMKRPFINSYYVSQYIYQKGCVNIISLQVPRTKPMENLVSSLLLVSVERNSANPWYSHAVSHDANSRTWDFLFVGKKGLQHFLRFRQMCKTNPVARMILKLPTE